MTPVPGERFGPLVQRPDRLSIRSIQHAPPVASYVYQADFKQHSQVLRDRRLLHPERVHYLANRPFLERDEVQDLPTPRFGYGIEDIRSCRRSCHVRTIHSHIGICQALFFSLRASLSSFPEDPLTCPYPSLPRCLTANPFSDSFTPNFPHSSQSSKEAAHGCTHFPLAPHLALGGHCVRGQLTHPHGAEVSPERLPATPGGR